MRFPHVGPLSLKQTAPVAVGGPPSRPGASDSFGFRKGWSRLDETRIVMLGTTECTPHFHGRRSTHFPRLSVWVQK